MVHVDLTGYVERLREGLLAAAASGGESMVDAAERLATTLESSVRMTLLEALSDVAAELTSELDTTTIEVRLKGRDPHFVVSRATAGEAGLDEEPSPPPGAAADERTEAEGETIARITLRLPDSVKQRAEDAATAARQSLNTWIVEAVRNAAATPTSGRRSPTVGRQLSGWVR